LTILIGVDYFLQRYVYDRFRKVKEVVFMIKNVNFYDISLFFVELEISSFAICLQLGWPFWFRFLNLLNK